MGVREDALHRALAGSLAEPAARHEALDRRVDLERVGRAGAVGGIEKVGDAVAHVGHELVGHHDAEGAEATDAADPEPVQPGHEEQRRPDERDQHGLAEVGLKDQRHDRQRQQQQRDEVARDVAAPGALGKGPGGDDDEGGLDELGRLDAEDPAPGALHLVAEHQGGADQRAHLEESALRHKAHVARLEERGRHHQAERRHQEHHLVVDEEEGREAQALGDRRAARHGEHDAEHDEQADGGQEPAVDGPPPVGEDRAFGARDHVGLLTRRAERSIMVRHPSPS